MIQDEETIELLDCGGRTWLQIRLHLPSRAPLRRAVGAHPAPHHRSAHGGSPGIRHGAELCARGVPRRAVPDCRRWPGGCRPGTVRSHAGAERPARPLTASDAAATDVTGVADRLAMISDAAGRPLISAWTRAAVAELAALPTSRSPSALACPPRARAGASPRRRRRGLGRRPRRRRTR